MIRGGKMGRTYSGCTFDNFDAYTRELVLAMDACRAVVDGTSRGVILLGKVGTGKTHLMAALAKEFAGMRPQAAAFTEPADMVPVPSLRELAKQADSEADCDQGPTLSQSEMGSTKWVEYWPVLDLVDALREGLSDPGKKMVATRCGDCDLLVLDDFGQERETPFAFEELARILDWRYRDDRPIAVSSNLTVEEIVAKYGERQISRWGHRCTIVAVTCADFRIGGKPCAN